jgi:hypothetical protein
MRFLSPSALALAIVALTACEQQAPEGSLTAPDVGSVFAANTLPQQCDAGTLRTISAQQADLWAKPPLDSARAHFAPVTANCGTQTGKDLMVDYVGWTIANRSAIITQKKGTANSNLLVHWNTVYPYAGYTGQDQPQDTAVIHALEADGAVGVINWTTTAELAATNAAMTVPAQDAAGDQRNHLYVIYPRPASCLTGTNLQQFGPCFQFSSFPHVSPVFSPKVKFGICQPISADDSISGHISSPALGHLDPITRITEATSVYPTFCLDLASAAPAGSWNDGLGGVVKRLAWLAKSTVTPKPLYAIHGGLGGLGGGMSPFGAVDLEVFSANFNGDAVGSAPGSPQTGSWTQQVKAPGTILVQSSLGNISSNVAVLNQAGGNCANCGGLLLQGNLEASGPAATAGIYDVEWISLQAQSNMKEAVFALRDSNGRDIARVTYAVRNNVNVILYNDIPATATTAAVPGIFLGNWTQNVYDSFKIRVNLDSPRTTTLWFNGSPVAAATGVGFVDTSAANFSNVAADFRGIDSGTMGWDNIKVLRLPDLNH